MDRTASSRRRRLVPVRALRWVVLLVVLTACAEPAAEPTDAGSPSPGCVAPAGAAQVDLDPEDSPELPFGQEAPGEPVSVHVENVNLDPRLWALVEEAADVWSRSPCVDLDTEGPCPTRTGCLSVRAHPRAVLERIEPDGGWGDTDGTFTGRDRRGTRLGGRISLNLDLFAETTRNGRLATITHEMGHALGLVHRLDPADLMNAETDDDTVAIPDATDFHNLLVIYGASGSG